MSSLLGSATALPVTETPDLLFYSWGRVSYWYLPEDLVLSRVGQGGKSIWPWSVLRLHITIQSLAVGGRASSCPLCQSAEQEAVTTCFQSPSDVKRVCTSFANWTVADMAFALTILAGKTAFSWVLRNIGGMLSFPSCQPHVPQGSDWLQD